MLCGADYQCPIVYYVCSVIVALLLVKYVSVLCAWMTRGISYYIVGKYALYHNSTDYLLEFYLSLYCNKLTKQVNSLLLTVETTRLE
jgi:hypothetical protein